MPWNYKILFLALKMPWNLVTILGKSLNLENSPGNPQLFAEANFLLHKMCFIRGTHHVSNNRLMMLPWKNVHLALENLPFSPIDALKSPWNLLI